MIHGIVFNFRNVIATFDNRKFTRALASYSVKGEEELYHIIGESESPKRSTQQLHRTSRHVERVRPARSHTRNPME